MLLAYEPHMSMCNKENSYKINTECQNKYFSALAITHPIEWENDMVKKGKSPLVESQHYGVCVTDFSFKSSVDRNENRKKSLNFNGNRYIAQFTTHIISMCLCMCYMPRSRPITIILKWHKMIFNFNNFFSFNDIVIIFIHRQTVAINIFVAFQHLYTTRVELKW